jgi:hypothetical protein
VVSAVGYKSRYYTPSGRVDTLLLQPTITQLREVLITEEGLNATDIVEKALEHLKENTYLGGFDAKYHWLKTSSVDLEGLSEHLLYPMVLS